MRFWKRLDRSRHGRRTSSTLSDGAPRLFSNGFAGSVRLADECGCPAGAGGLEPPHWTTTFHADVQDTECEGWHRLLEVIDQAAEDGRAEFVPGQDLGPDLWKQIVVLPRSISKLKDVERLLLYGSNLRSIPPEIGEMASLRVFDPYTSYRLHWFPYELRRCMELSDSTVSTRTLYGNRKERITFPKLPAAAPADSMPSKCSVCSERLLDSHETLQRWISLKVATDVLPLLVHACSPECIDALPTPPESYLDYPHEGGTVLEQPAADW